MNILSHPMLNEIRTHFVLLDDSKIEIIPRCNLSKSTIWTKDFHGNINWGIIEGNQTLKWDKLYSSEIMNRLKQSILSNYEFVYVQLGYEEPVYQIPTLLFIEYWEEILHISVFGFPVMTPDKRFYLEWLHTSKDLYSNFSI